MALQGAFDAVAFGPSKTLDLHGSPSAEDAVSRAERWLRERQVANAGVVLVITGRGARSVGGVAVLRPAVEKLLSRLRRQGVVARVQAHTEGSFSVALAPVTALLDAPRRARGARDGPGTVTPARGQAIFAGLAPATTAVLRELAERSLHALGAATTETLVDEEIHRQLSLLAKALPPGEDPDRALQRIAKEAIEAMEDR